MRISVVLAHPNPGSFNHAIARTAVERLRADGHEVLFHDLYEERFPPELPAEEFRRRAELPPLVAEHCGELREAEGLVIVHPNWWGQPPAVLKGWVDRVMRPGLAYEFLEGDSGEGVPRGLLRTRGALIFNTSNTDPRREAEVFGDPLERIWRNCIFRYCGVENVRRRNFAMVVTSTDAERRRWLDEVKEEAGAFFGA
ncbi:MAG: NAD(P)H-dependent oxidoreductase [Deltaproteobacteria bacterium]|nr:NAD(P)H-dependent oxidoreductase [Deltaproteobacteria bacterium]